MSDYSPRVSVGLPVYNGERFLRDALDSILAQTYDDWELIISDNASTDRTAEICQAYAARDKRVRYYRNDTNLGLAKNFNHVFQLSSGEYFKWVAADDVIAPEFLERCVEALDREPEGVLAYSRVKVIDENSRVLPDAGPKCQHIDWRPKAVDRFRQLLDEAPWRMQFIFGLIRSDALRDTRLMGSYPASDCTLVAELILLGKFCEVPEYLTFLRHHPGSSWPDRSTKELQELFDPAVKGRVALMASGKRGYYEYIALVPRSPLDLHEKIILLAYNIGRPLKRLWKARVQ